MRASRSRATTTTRATSGTTMRACSRRLRRKRGAAWTTAHIADLVARKAVRLEVLERDASLLFPGAAAAVRRAAAAVPVAIASGALGAEIRRVLDREQLTSCFTAIVAAEDTPFSKPAPDPYLRALVLLAIRARRRVRGTRLRRRRRFALGSGVGARRGTADRRHHAHLRCVGARGCRSRDRFTGRAGTARFDTALFSIDYRIGKNPSTWIRARSHSFPAVISSLLNLSSPGY